MNPFDIEAAIGQIEAGARALLERAGRLLTIGGDHTIALPLLRAVAAKHGPVAVVHFDAHLDTWDTYFGAAYTHGTPFRRASEEGLLDRSGCLHVGIRGPLYATARTSSTTASWASRSCTRVEIDDLGVARRRRADPRAGRGPAGLRLGRHRRARPGLRARHRHPRGRRADQPRAARRPARRSPT